MAARKDVSVTALMSTYNGAHHIGDTIRSVLEQSMQDFELLIVDDGSSDATVEVVQSFSDPRIRLLKLPVNVGVGAALNLAVAHARGHYLAKVDDDDLSEPERFRHQVETLESYPGLGLVKGVIEFFPDNGEVEATARYRWLKEVKEKELNAVESPAAIASTLWDWCCIPHTSIMARTELVRHYGYPPWRMGEDYALFYRMNADGVAMGMEPRARVRFRVSSESTTAVGVHQRTWVQSVYRLKRNRVLAFVAEADRVCIVGAGQLAQGLRNCLAEDGIDVERIVEWRDGRLHSWPDGGDRNGAETASGLTGYKVFVACQPVRQQVCDALTAAGIPRGAGFFVFA